MFYYIRGGLTVKEATKCVVEASGVGYSLTISGTTYANLPAPSMKNPPEVLLYTKLSVREDGVELFGFGDKAEQEAFLRLTSVSGVGPKVAMGVLSAMTPDKLALAIATEDRKALSSAPGVGAKTAARIILELKDKIAKELGSDIFSGGSVTTSAPVNRGKLSEAVDALVVLGYSRSEAMSVLSTLDTEHTELEELIRLALKKMMRG